MFDVGFSELLLTALVALIVLGPERLPKAARMAGLFVSRARRQWYSMKSELETELANEELRGAVAGVTREIEAVGDDLRMGLSHDVQSLEVPVASDQTAATPGDAA